LFIVVNATRRLALRRAAAYCGVGDRRRKGSVCPRSQSITGELCSGVIDHVSSVDCSLTVLIVETGTRESERASVDADTGLLSVAEAPARALPLHAGGRSVVPVYCSTASTDH